MPIHNADIARIFEEIADLLDLKGENRFRIRAYRNAARTLAQLSRPVSDMVEEGENLADLPDIGDDLAEKITVILDTGTLPLLEDLEDEINPAMADLMDIPGLGPKRVRMLHETLGVSTLDDLKAEAEAGKIRTVEGFGEKIEQNILDGIVEAGEAKRWLRSRAEPVVTSLVDYLSGHDDVERVEVAGSYRRRRETVGDLDILAMSNDGGAVVEHFVAYEDVVDVASKGDTQSTVRLRSGLQVDLRVVPHESYGAALVYFTGSKAHNVALRKRAVERTLKVNEYGVFDTNNEQKRIAGETEESVYETLDLPYIVPELREDRGEIIAAEKGTLPRLITGEALRGNLHTHTTDSDGRHRHSLREMAEAARDRGMEYLAITDHSPAVAVAQGLSEDDLRRQMDAIDALNDELDDLHLLKSIEVDIMKDGTLDLPDDVLDDLDFCVCAVHTSLNLSEEKQTARILRAMDNPNFTILAHPTGRRINERGPMALNLDRIMEAAVERGCYLEVNAQPERLDIDDVLCRRAKDIGLMVAISADAHSRDDLDLLTYGVDQARRGWLEPDDVLNTKTWPELARLFAS
ncbi:MAG: DNA polymerase/3'-5' exonuclease PolX [Bacteroidetes bacterium]|jgi:DNA polymerase (family 10)|nr:DNA polymerase/3'-5' exonuclease PolX [Bacteroidota bacterium]